MGQVWFMAQKVTAMDVRAATALAGQVENVAGVLP